MGQNKKVAGKTTKPDVKKVKRSTNLAAKAKASKKPASVVAHKEVHVAAKPKTSAKPAPSVKPASSVKHPAATAHAPKASTSVERKPEPKVLHKPAPPKSTMGARQAPHGGAQRATTAAMSKPAQPKISAPVTPKDLALKAAEARQAAQAAKKPISQRHGFKTNEFIVYPAHGVGRIVGIEEQEIAGMSLELFVITFDKDKMTLRVPTGKLQSVGMRKLADDDIVKRAMETLKGRARVKRTMWSRRAQEYEAKINSGDLVSIAEVVRDLYRSETQPEQSYSERQLYEAALDRMAREIAAVEKLDERGAVQRITEVLSKSARGRRVAAEDAAAEGADVKAA